MIFSVMDGDHCVVSLGSLVGLSFGLVGLLLLENQE